MRKILPRILILLLVIAALGWLLYPTAADQLARKGYLEKEEAYLRTVRGMTAEAAAEMLENADRANREASGEIRPGDMFTAPAGRSSVKYRNLLDFGDGMIGRIEEECGRKMTVVATGGLSGSIVPLCRHKGIIQDDQLLLRGLRYIYEANA